MEDCALSRGRLGEGGEELGIPVYLYEYAPRAKREETSRTSRGGIRGSREEARRSPVETDFGPAELNAKSGATVIGARKFLIAYNVNLNTRDRKLANDIAFSIREAGRSKRDENGAFVRDENGGKVNVPGTSGVQGGRVVHPEYKRAQVSINLVDYHVTAPTPRSTRQSARRKLSVCASRGASSSGSSARSDAPRGETLSHASGESTVSQRRSSSRARSSRSGSTISLPSIPNRRSSSTA